MKRNILIDFDGVLNNYCGVFNYKTPKIANGCEEFLKELSKNFTVYIFTARNKNSVQNWINKNNLNKYVKDVTNIKIPAYLIIDDRCITFNGNFKDTILKIQNFQVWYKSNS